jgi:dCMP deaminase
MWDYRFLDLADLVASWSKDPSTKVGAVIVDSKNRVVSLGYNGFPRGVEDVVMDREVKLLRTIHAEENALHFAYRDVEGCRMYVSMPPCAKCSAQIVQRGISEVIYRADSAYMTSFIARWSENLLQSEAILQEAGIRLRGINRWDGE